MFHENNNLHIKKSISICWIKFSELLKNKIQSLYHVWMVCYCCYCSCCCCCYQYIILRYNFHIRAFKKFKIIRAFTIINSVYKVVQRTRNNSNNNVSYFSMENIYKNNNAWVVISKLIFVLLFCLIQWKFLCWIAYDLFLLSSIMFKDIF